MQKNLLKVILCIGLFSIPFAFKRENLKDWLLIFFLKGYISSFLNQVVVRSKAVSYPIRFMPKYFKLNILFDYLLFPLLCVLYNRTSVKSKPFSIILQPMIYSIPITIIEFVLEKYTKLIEYKKNWNWVITYSTLVITFLFSRVFISITRKLHIDKKERS
ncbi:MAG: hypothetical protein LPK26_03130 [Bacillaceae bacterium]|nr:hypothetical protein [Bacillaceae bacterium]